MAPLWDHGLWGVLLLSVWMRRRRRTLLPWAFAVLNAAFFGATFVLATRAWGLALLWLPQPRPEVDLGYHRTWPGIVLLVVLLALYYLAQWRGLALWDRVRLAPRERMAAVEPGEGDTTSRRSGGWVPE